MMGKLSDGLLIRDLFAVGVCGYLAVRDDLPACLLTAVETVSVSARISRRRRIRNT